ncbi:MAG: hypothetical protein Q8M88_00455 [Phenylobacterium sp.]|uniref:hypothetical protein n=1 Tax=Phenylobacterium sp. TaxID=1871053 RepID=UPI002737005F|nr:hypothetical protein [Phenylobacterium sp.]MDP3172887.1 hypothetical protein [Phenylobacterium sp.]
MNSLAVVIAVLATGPLMNDLTERDDQCLVIRYAADGQRMERAPTRPYEGPPSAAVSANSVHRGSGGSSSSSSVSASSSSAGGQVVLSTTADGRSVTRTYHQKGCTVVVDERPARGGR